jgi:hypothetical protein
LQLLLLLLPACQQLPATIRQDDQENRTSRLHVATSGWPHAK